MIKIDSYLGIEMGHRLENFRHGQRQAGEKMAEAATISADAATHLTASLTATLGQGVIVLAGEMTYAGRLIDRLVQIAELVAGKPGTRLEAVTYRTEDAIAIIVLLRTALGIEVSIKVDGDWDDITHGTNWRAKAIGNALGIEVPIIRK